MKKAFTLAEIMIVLTVIGVLTAILLPVAYNAAPDEDVMKFKKANSTLASVIRELVNSDKYYLDGDLGTKPDGNLITSATYFCESIADITQIKTKSCSEIKNTEYRSIFVDTREEYGSSTEAAKAELDEACKNFAQSVGEEIVFPDGVVFYQTSPHMAFGIMWNYMTTSNENSNVSEETLALREGMRLFSAPNNVIHADSNGFDGIYKTVCIDIDGIDTGEDPFGYGIRADGKILAGARADEWMEKSIQRGNND